MEIFWLAVRYTAAKQSKVVSLQTEDFPFCCHQKVKREAGFMHDVTWVTNTQMRCSTQQRGNISLTDLLSNLKWVFKGKQETKADISLCYWKMFLVRNNRLTLTVVSHR